MAITVQFATSSAGNLRVQEQARVLAEQIIRLSDDSVLETLDPCTMIDLNDVLELIEWTQGRRTVSELSLALQARIREAR